MYITNTTDKGEGSEESDPPPVSEEGIPTDYSGPFRPYEDICNEMKNVKVYRPFYTWLVGSGFDPEARTIFI
jgi:hypothetical protein